MVAIDDEINMASPYRSGFNLTLVSEDKNYGGQLLPNFNITVEDNDHGTVSISVCTVYSCIMLLLWRLMAYWCTLHNTVVMYMYITC